MVNYMNTYLVLICLILALIIVLLWMQNKQLYKEVDEIRHSFRMRLSMDTNVGVDTGSANPAIKALAADLDQQLKLLRKEQLRYYSKNQALHETMTNLGHDIRTPLTAIMAYLDLLQEEIIPQPARQYIDVITSRIQVLKTLVEDLFQYTVASAPASKPAELLHVNHYLETSIAQQYAAFTARQITPKITIPAAPVKCQLHPVSLIRILDNIISNALKYSDGDLSIQLSPDGTMTFTNHTSSLDEIAAGKLMDRYYTIADGTSSSGLGLHIAKTLTKQMGGTMQVSLKDRLFTVLLQFPVKKLD